MTSLLPPSARTQPPVTDEPASPLLTVDVSTLGHRVELAVFGEIDLATVGLLSSALADAIQAGATALRVDLDGVSYLDSTGLGALVAAHKRLASSGGRLEVHCTHPRLLRLFTLTGLTNVLSIDDEPPTP